jgi:hypothetical protein
MIPLRHIDDHLQAPWVNRSPNLVRTNHTVPYGTTFDIRFGTIARERLVQLLHHTPVRHIILPWLMNGSYLLLRI